MKKFLFLFMLYSYSTQAEVKIFYPDITPPPKQQPSNTEAPVLQPTDERQTPVLPEATTKKRTTVATEPNLQTELLSEEDNTPKEPAKPDWFERTLGIPEVKPWEKGYLAENALSPEGAMPAMNEFRQKVFISKENTNGGYGISGSGCGCN